MTEYSYPVVGEPMGATGWSSVTKGVGNGILDQGGFPYRLVFESNANATNQGIMKAPPTTSANQNYGHAIVEGFYHRYDQDVTLDFPAVTSATTYMVILQYDPSNTTLPVRLRVVTSLSYTQGKNHLHLYNVVRQPNQLLTAAAVRMVRPRVAPIMVVSDEADLPKAFKTLWGTLAIVHNGRTGDNTCLYMAMNRNADGEATDTTEDSWFWKKIYDPNADDFTYTWETRADTSTYYSFSGYQRAIGRRGKRRSLRGRVALVGSDRKFQVRSDAYNVFSGNLDSGDAPQRPQKFIVSVDGTPGGYAAVNIGTDGSVSAWVSSTSNWISLDGVAWEVP